MLARLRKLPNHYLLTIFALLFLGHLIVLLIYTEQHRNSMAIEKHDEIIQRVMNIIHMVQATPNKELPQAIAAIVEPNLKVSMSNKPLHLIHVTELTYWGINHMVPKGDKSVALSLLLADGQWLNVQAFITINTILPTVLLLCAELLIISIIFFYLWSINRFHKPLKDFQRTAERLGVEVEHQPELLEEYYGPSIIRETARAMNQMQQRIKDLLDDRTLMLAAISHDLRTPITRLKLRIDQSADKQFVEKSLRDLDEMNAMIAKILAFAQSNKDNEKKSRFDLNSLLQLICDEFTDCGDKVYFFSQHQRVAFRGRHLSLKRALINVIENAIKYGSQARVTLKASKKQLFIFIDDTGPGIPSRELGNVFSPFYRCDQSRSQKIPGTGLGLAVARDIIRAHRGELQLSNRSEGGLRVKISLPK